MNRERFESIYPEMLTPKQKQVLTRFITEGLINNEIAEELKVHHTAISHQVRNICGKFEIRPVNDPYYRQSLVALFVKFRPNLVCDKVREKYGYGSRPRYPDGPEPLNSKFYLEPKVEADCYKKIEEPGALLRIRAPKQMGKTSLLIRIMNKAKIEPYHTAYLNLSLINISESTSLSAFLQKFYTSVRLALPNINVLNDLSNASCEAQLDEITNCTLQFQSLLEQIPEALVLILDEVDWLFEYEKIYIPFFTMLRGWHETANDGFAHFETWNKLRLVIAYSREDYGKLDINKSPFNVGVPFHLVDLTIDQIDKLVRLHNLDLKEVRPLAKLVEGHPFLMRLGLYYRAECELTIQQLITEAKDNGGIYQSHLQRLLDNLIKAGLSTLYRKILQHDEPHGFREDTLQIKQLEHMGLIRLEGDFVQPRCVLYRHYFPDRVRNV